MEILSAEQIRAWDEYTIQHEPIASIDLMERAAASCLAWLEKQGYLDRSFSIYCGKGNNGGDGLALARMLSLLDCPVTVHILEFGNIGTEDFQGNLARLHQTPVEVRFVQGPEHFHPVPQDDILIDALLGSGLNRPLEGVTAQLVEHLNASGNEIIAIDIPSGLFVSRSAKGNTVIRASHTLSFQVYKPAFLMPENEVWVGEVHILDIGLHPGFLSQIAGEAEILDPDIIGAIFRPRQAFAHKGNFGHALLVAGSYGKMGAAVLAARACLRTGSGLLTCAIPGCGYAILQTALPEAMLVMDPDEKIHTAVPDGLDKYSVIGVGPGLGQDQRTVAFLRSLLQQSRKPVVVDADALNILASHPHLLSLLPPYSILTPHPKEFERLFGPSPDDYVRVEKAREQARKLGCIIVLKGHYSLIAMPGGKSYFNSTGNPGMAKGGSGDVLTGILTALLGQSYSPGEAALLGVYLHGLAGDLAADTHSQESMLPSDLTDHLGKAFQIIQKR
ncbi:NAD(P)H-hydrate dehydratase [Puia dinghuensis]|uniref:Bifunctional NAD(P)H-hydrate repair enzyme n=1 Tax=Puia dinghuensis TaxID=1792502 RepID=A0A8J2U888_9BACT|nr:NAD(P)H-hydrate dehydratase [Puia dinghuensis]GGA85164.1 bifunctional NAD(P)H-hydrate repair enzyme [Puia dinghuensis]